MIMTMWIFVERGKNHQIHLYVAFYLPENPPIPSFVPHSGIVANQ
jgi:hypothetical protein